jgi:hypothetical protein
MVRRASKLAILGRNTRSMSASPSTQPGSELDVYGNQHFLRRETAEIADPLRLAPPWRFSKSGIRGSKNYRRPPAVMRQP